MKVKDHLKFCCFKYFSTDEITPYALGDVVIKDPDPDYSEPDDKPEIGVVIQVHDWNELRTDMFGNASISEIRLATREEIELYRNDILIDIE
jgi:hypothetical protein